MPGSTVNAAAELMRSTCPFRFRDLGQRRVRGEHRPDEVDLDRARERVRGAGHDGGQRRDAGVGDHDVEASEGVHGPLDGGRERVGVGDVGLHPQVLRPELRRHGRQLLRLQPDQRHASAAGGRPARQLGNDSPGGAGDQDRPAGQGRAGTLPAE